MIHWSYHSLAQNHYNWIWESVGSLVGWLYFSLVYSFISAIRLYVVIIYRQCGCHRIPWAPLKSSWYLLQMPTLSGEYWYNSWSVLHWNIICSISHDMCTFVILCFGFIHCQFLVNSYDWFTTNSSGLLHRQLNQCQWRNPEWEG